MIHVEPISHGPVLCGDISVLTQVRHVTNVELNSHNMVIYSCTDVPTQGINHTAVIHVEPIAHVLVLYRDICLPTQVRRHSCVTFIALNSHKKVIYNHILYVLTQVRNHSDAKYAKYAKLNSYD